MVRFDLVGLGSWLGWQRAKGVRPAKEQRTNASALTHIGPQGTRGARPAKEQRTNAMMNSNDTHIVPQGRPGTSSFLLLSHCLHHESSHSHSPHSATAMHSYYIM